MGKSPRCIVRFSGKDSIELVANVCHHKETIVNSVGYRFYDSSLNCLSLSIPVYIYVMKGPASYTREDMIELHMPGSPFIVSQVITWFLKTSETRLAEPGEFTKLAFLNGRLDLIQAESVTQLIMSKSEQEYRKALDALTGRVSSMIEPLREKIFFLARDLTVDLDFDEEIDEQHLASVRLTLLNIKKDLLELSDKIILEEEVVDQFQIILCGPVNAGKSTIYNSITGDTSAIVSDIKGTTRDIIKWELEINDQNVVLQDCPGWGIAVDTIDQKAQDLSLQTIETADLILVILDGSVEFSHQKPVKPPQWLGRCQIIINKSDLPQLIDINEICEYFKINENELMYRSKFEKNNLLYTAFEKFIEESELSSSKTQLSARQQKEVFDSLSAIELAVEAVDNGIGVDAIEFEVRRSLYSLSRITGDEVDEDILTSIFESFCIGK